MASLDCQFGHLECEWVDQGMMQVGLFFRCCFMCCHTLPPVGARRAWWFSCLPLRGSPRMGGWNGDLKGWRRARNKKIIDIQKKKNLVLWEGIEWDGPVKTYLVPWSLRLKGDPGERWQLFRTLGPPERPNSGVSTFFSECIFITLKHTQSENGKVTITMTQEKAVRSHPQIPMPMSPSLAGRKEKKLRVGQKVRKTFFSSWEK